MSDRPKIVMTLLVRNEEDILADNVRFHHAMGVDAFIVMDNLSTDRTAKIIQDLSREFTIDYLYQTDDDYSQSAWVTEMARRAAVEHEADWVINNDADEFWICAEGDLKSYLAGLPEDVGIVDVQRHNATVSCSEGAPLDGYCHPRHSAVFERQSLNVKGHPLPGKVLHRADVNVVVAQGNHAVQGIQGRTMLAGERLKILHFPFRSLLQYESKIRLGGAAYERNSALPPAIGGTWRAHYSQLMQENAGLAQFWADLSLTPKEIDIGLYAGTLERDERLLDFFAGREDEQTTLASRLSHLLNKTEELVRDYKHGLARSIAGMKRDERWQRPGYHNLKFAVSGAEAHLEYLWTLAGVSGSKQLAARFSEIRDCFSLFPRNGYLRKFLGQILEMSHPAVVAKLRSDCAGRKVILHVSCKSRYEDTLTSVASFRALEGNYHHIILMGQAHRHDERDVPLSLEYDGQVLRVPAPDNYESLHRKLFYAFMLLDCLTEPELVVKVDDNLVVSDPSAFDACLRDVVHAGAAYAGRQVGFAAHHNQLHGWHLGKCTDPLIETRGYQFPLPRSYAAGGYGYVLNRDGLSACSYMYLAMQAFFSMPVIGLEDAYVGHAVYAQGLELLDISHPEKPLALSGLMPKEVLERERGWRDIFGPS